MGSTVGSVIPTLGALIPSAVGVDIGCGMAALRTQFIKSDFDGKDLAALRHSIERSIPLSVGGKNQTITETASKRIHDLETLAGDRLSFYDSLVRGWDRQLGSLGSGNHFIEIVTDEEDRVWVFLHSGSRGIGNKIAAHHIKIAQKLCERWFITLEHRDLAYLIEDTPEFDQYITDLHWAQQFALFNREEMLDRVVKDVGYFMKTDVEITERVNTHHNYTVKEHHMGRDLWITRKGAISAQEGQLGLIPGSMGTGSFVVMGKGNKPSFCSAPHGAGRKYSRTEARRQFTVEDMKKVMKGIEYREEEVLLDEIPGAYKPIETVMDDAKELVDIIHKFTQLINVKGD
jgi:tRNA-splicing ligase RtcB